MGTERSTSIAVGIRQPRKRAGAGHCGDPRGSGLSRRLRSREARALLPTPRRAGTCGQDARGPGPRLRRGCASHGGRRAGRRRAGETPAHPGSAPERAGHCGDPRGSGLSRRLRSREARALLPTPRRAGRCGQDARGPGPRLRRGCASPRRHRAGRRRAGETPAHPGSAPERCCGALRGSAGLGAVETLAVPGSARPPADAAAGGNVRAGCPAVPGPAFGGCASPGGRRARRPRYREVNARAGRPRRRRAARGCRRNRRASP